MDFVNWCTHVLERLVAAAQGSPQARTLGLVGLEVDQAVFGEQPPLLPGFREQDNARALEQALSALECVGLLEPSSMGKGARVSRAARPFLQDPTPLWSKICDHDLEPEEAALIRILNRLSRRDAQEYAWLALLDRDELLAEWTKDLDELIAVGDAVSDLGLGYCRVVGMGRPPVMRGQATYEGLVWETRRGFTKWSRLIDELRASGESANVDFKRELHTGTKDEIAELMKDILALANTQVTAQRWLIVGFDPKTLDYYGPPDPRITQDHLEDLLSCYTKPVVTVKYEVVDYRREGPAAVLAVLRDPRQVPYRVARSVGDRNRKRILADTVFARHGSHTAIATDEEVQALEEEAAWAQQRDPSGGRAAV